MSMGEILPTNMTLPARRKMMMLPADSITHETWWSASLLSMWGHMWRASTWDEATVATAPLYPKTHSAKTGPQYAQHTAKMT